jgi:hypothetical protein
MRFNPATKNVTIWDKGSKSGTEKGYDVTGWTDSKLHKNRVELSVTPVVTAKSSRSHKSETVLALEFADAQKKLDWCNQFKQLDDDGIGQPPRGKAQ